MFSPDIADLGNSIVTVSISTFERILAVTPVPNS